MEEKFAQEKCAEERPVFEIVESGNYTDKKLQRLRSASTAFDRAKAVGKRARALPVTRFIGSFPQIQTAHTV